MPKKATKLKVMQMVSVKTMCSNSLSQKVPASERTLNISITPISTAMATAVICRTKVSENSNLSVFGSNALATRGRFMTRVPLYR